MSDDACQWNGHDVVISTCDFFLLIALYVAWYTRKSWAFSDLTASISAANSTRFLFVVNTLTVFLSFCYIECELFALFIKILFDNWRRFCCLSVVYVPVKCPRGGGIWSAVWTLVRGIVNGILAQVGGNLNNNFRKSPMPGGLPGGDVEASIWPIHKFPICMHATSATS